ncbi:hypothetical protein F5144DRAFT_565010 [Chaetomium tenue]|uniref:Uncharacterized protein n=1 Tax=Chaetomium tenue TaxID=1854479 RepID=A0ACB7PIQ1_9PEZI|nr:hypothetical protein F5144DRAFT_565010 [Chaetomium globosum]
MQKPRCPCPETVLADKPPVATAYIEIEMSDDTLDLNTSPPVGWPNIPSSYPPCPGSQAVQRGDSNLDMLYCSHRLPPATPPKPSVMIKLVPGLELRSGTTGRKVKKVIVEGYVFHLSNVPEIDKLFPDDMTNIALGTERLPNQMELGIVPPSANMIFST